MNPLVFVPVVEADLEALVALRIAAMRESLERAGRFDPQRARERFTSSFQPQHCFHLCLAGQRVGFLSLLRQPDAFVLQHFYLDPAWQGRGLGAQALRRVLAMADRLALPVRLGALRGSDANRFYQRHGFVQVGEETWDIHYERPAATVTSPLPAAVHEISWLACADIAPLTPILRQHVRDLHSGEVVESEVAAIIACMQGGADDDGRHRAYLVARGADGAALGCMALGAPEARMAAHFSDLAGGALELLNVFVHADRMRGQGVGRALLEAAMQEAVLIGALRLLVNSGLRYRASWGFYDRLFDGSHGMLDDYYGPGRHAKAWSQSLVRG